MSACDVRLTADIVYGQGVVRASNPQGASLRPLMLDLYEPATPGDGPRPALILAFGGAFHRGNRKEEEFGEAPWVNTSMAEYCRRFAARGYVACSIDYRLVQEDPDPGKTPVIVDPDAIPRSRVDTVRQLLGLPPATQRQLWQGIEAACDDMVMAFRFLQANARQWRIDPQRIAVGGFSAGARTALNAAYGERIDAAAVVSLSGLLGPDELARHLPDAAGRPPLLLVSAERDLDYIAAQTPRMLAHFQSIGLPFESAFVPSGTHFYPAEAQVRMGDGRHCTLEDAFTRFIDRHLSSGRGQAITGKRSHA